MCLDDFENEVLELHYNCRLPRTILTSPNVFSWNVMTKTLSNILWKCVALFGKVHYDSLHHVIENSWSPKKCRLNIRADTKYKSDLVFNYRWSSQQLKSHNNNNATKYEKSVAYDIPTPTQYSNVKRLTDSRLVCFQESLERTRVCRGTCQF